MGLSICDTWVVTAPRSLDEVLADLASVQDELLAVADDDFAAKAAMSNRQDALRSEAAEARSEIPSDVSVDELVEQIELLEAEILRHLDTRLSASSGAGGGGQGGGGIDPYLLHRLHAQMGESFGLEEKKEKLRRLRNRLAELQEE